MTIHPDLIVLASLMDVVKSYLSESLGEEIVSNWTTGMYQLGDLVEMYRNDWLSQMHGLLGNAGVFALGEGSANLATVLLLTAGIIIFLGVAGEAFFKRTGIPDVVFLLVLGMVIGPVMGIVEQETVVEIVPYFAAIALIMIMFDGGMNLDLRHLKKTGHIAAILAVAGFAVSVIIVAVLAHYVIGWEWLDSILLGSIVGGSSSIIVFGLVRNLTISENAKNMLAFESAITDVLATIIAFVMFEAIISGMFSVGQVVQTIGSSMAVGLVLGLGVGIPWMIITSKIAKTQHAYMLTLGMLFVLYFLANHLGESGALTALIFGLMIGNRRRLSRILRIKIRNVEMDDSVHNHLTFLVRVFFFVFIGLLASFGDLEFVIFGIIATVGIYAGRVLITRAVLHGRLSILDRNVTKVMIPRGLAAAVLAALPITLGLQNGEAYPQIVFFVILTSVIITTIGLTAQKEHTQQRTRRGGLPSGRLRKWATGRHATLQKARRGNQSGNPA